MGSFMTASQQDFKLKSYITQLTIDISQLNKTCNDQEYEQGEVLCFSCVWLAEDTSLLKYW